MGKDMKGLMCITLHGIASKHPFLIRLREPGSVFERVFFSSANRQEVECYPVEKNGIAEGKIPKNLINVVEKGQKKIKENFKAKLYESFPDLRYEILSS